MILSFHPCFVGDKNIICAGREPDAEDLSAIKKADAVILPQGCTESLYKIVRDNTSNIFPNYEARFKYPGKIEQIKLFKKAQIKYPQTEIFNNVKNFTDKFNSAFPKLPIQMPFVFKFDWGGDADNVFLVKTMEHLDSMLKKAVEYEKTGQTGFMIQEFVPSLNRSLRVVVIGQKIISYWRIWKHDDLFCTSIKKGARIDHSSDPDMQHAACVAAKLFCKDTGINLAGFDFLFSSKNSRNTPFFLEINYFFGRKGLGGSENYYNILVTEINKWLDSIGLKVNRK
jgi:ribosomal protein S6--L-glutamate ligase